MTTSSDNFSFQSIRESASYVHGILGSLCWAFCDEDIDESKLSAATFVELKLLLTDIGRKAKKIPAVVDLAKHETRWGHADEGDESDYDHQRGSYFAGVAPNGRL